MTPVKVGSPLVWSDKWRIWVALGSPEATPERVRELELGDLTISGGLGVSIRSSDRFVFEVEKVAKAHRGERTTLLHRGLYVAERRKR